MPILWDEDGTAHSFSDEAAKTVAAGGRFSVTPPKPAPEAAGPDVAGGLEAAGAGLVRGASMGLSDVAARNLSPETADKMAALRQAHPYISTGSEIAGAVIPSLLIGPEAEGPEAAGLLRGAARMTPAGLTAMAGRGVEAGAGRLAAGAVEGAAYGVAGQLSEDSLGDHEANAEHYLAAAGLGALFGGTTTGALAGAKAIGTRVLKTSGRMLETLSTAAEPGLDDAIGALRKQNDPLNFWGKIAQTLTQDKDKAQALSRLTQAGDAGVRARQLARTPDSDFQSIVEDLTDGLNNHVQDFKDASLKLKDLKWQQIDPLLEQIPAGVARDEAAKLVNDSRAKVAEMLQHPELYSSPKVIQRIHDITEALAKKIGPPGTVRLPFAGEDLPELRDMGQDPYAQAFWQHLNETIGGGPQTIVQEPYAATTQAAKEAFTRTPSQNPDWMQDYGSPKRLRESLQRLMGGEALRSNKADKYLADMLNEARGEGSQPTLRGVKLVQEFPSEDEWAAQAPSTVDYANARQEWEAEQAWRGTGAAPPPIAPGQLLSVNPEMSTKDLFHAIDDYRAQMGSPASWSKELQLASDPNSISAARDLGNGRAATLLSNPDLWGQAGAIQGTTNAAISDYLNARSRLLKAKVLGGRGDEFGQVVAGRVETMLESMGLASNRNRLDALGDYFAKAEKVAQMLPDDPSLKEVAATAYKGTQEAAEVARLRAELSRLRGQTIGAATAYGNFLQHIPGVPTRLADMLPMFSALSTAKAMSERALTAGAYLAVQSDGAGEVAIPAVVKALDAVRFSNRDYLRPARSPEEAYQRRAGELQQASGDPARMMEDLRNQTAWMRVMAPRNADAYAAAAGRAYQYLSTKLPQDPFAADRPLAVGTEAQYTPPTDRLESFGNTVRAVSDPVGSTFRDLKAGRITAETMDALQNVYPRTLQSMRQAILQAVQEQTKPLSYNQKLALGTFLGVPTDPSLKPEIISTLQGVIKGPPQQPPSQPPKRPTLRSSRPLRPRAKISIARRAMTENERLEAEEGKT